MNYLVDTDYTADYLKGYERATTVLTTLFAQGIGISIITFAEVYEGIYFGEKKTQHETGFRNLLKSTPVLGITRPFARQFARIRGTLRTRGQLITDPDILIAATAINHNLTLVTRNIKDYQRIPNLTIYKAG
jgi:tRNA(fMet)-specific endonuclease VapC